MANNQKMEALESTIKTLINEYNKISGPDDIKFGLVSGFNGEAYKDLLLYSPGVHFRTNDDDWYSSTAECEGWYSSSSCSF